LSKLRVMVIDPSMYSRMVLNNILVSNGYSVCYEASNGADALAHYERARPDVVIVEATMPDQDGIATITELCRTHLGCRAILMASAGQRSYVCQAMSAGAVDFIPKPINDRRVLRTLKKL
jgi:two-component system, chemotaxis family, chemotaxis protein CheY